MAQIFGNRWTSSFGDEPAKVWVMALAELTDEDLTRGVQACLESGAGWPPTLPEFIALCGGITDRLTRREIEQLSDHALCGLALRSGISTRGKTRRQLVRDLAEVHDPNPYPGYAMEDTPEPDALEAEEVRR